MSWILPNGIDFADGETEMPVSPIGASGTPTIIGTPLPTGQFQVWSNAVDDSGTYIVESAGSPRLEQAMQCTCEHNLTMDNATGINYFYQMSRGSVVTDTDANIWRILSCDYTRESALYVTLHYVMESISFDTPPDTFAMPAVQLDINIIKYPRYWRWLSPYSTDGTVNLGSNALAQNVPLTTLKEAIIRICQNYIESPFYPSQSMTQNYLQANIIDQLNSGQFQVPVHNPNFAPGTANVVPVVWDGNSTPPTANCPYFLVSAQLAWQNDDPNVGPIHMALAAATELISKLWRQEDTPYLVGYEVTWTQYFFQPVYLNPGGYQEDPRDWVPSYFMSPGLVWPPENSALTPIPQANQEANPYDIINGDNLDQNQPADGATIFDLLAKINPQSYSSDGTANGSVVLSSLREADDWEFDRTWFSIVHKWKVAPVGRWDSDLYLEMGDSAPQSVSDFNQYPGGPGDI